MALVTFICFGCSMFLCCCLRVVFPNMLCCVLALLFVMCSCVCFDPCCLVVFSLFVSVFVFCFVVADCMWSVYVFSVLL